MLVAEVSEEFVFDQRATHSATQGFAMQLRHGIVGENNVGVLLVEEGRSIQPVRSTVPVDCTVNCVGSRGRAHVNVRAAGRALLGVVHGRVHAHLLNGLWGRSRQCLTDCEVDRCGALDGGGVRARDSGHTGIVHDAGRGHLAGAFAVEQVAGVDSVQQEAVAGVTLAISPDGLIPQATVDAGAAGQFGTGSGRKNGQPRETAGRQRHGIDLILFEDVTVRGVHRVQQGGRVHFDDRAYLTDGQRGVDGGGPVGLHRDGRNLFAFKPVVSEGERVGADGQVHEVVAAIGIRLLGTREFCLVTHDRHIGSRQDAAGLVCDCAGDAAERLLRPSIRCERRVHPHGRGGEDRDECSSL